MICSVCFTLFTSKHTKVEIILIIWRKGNPVYPSQSGRRQVCLFVCFFPVRARSRQAHLKRQSWLCGGKSIERGLKSVEPHLVQKMCLLSLFQRQQRKDPRIQWLSVNHHKEGAANIFTLVIVQSSLLYGIKSQVGILQTYWNHNIPFK